MFIKILRDRIDLKFLADRLTVQIPDLYVADTFPPPVPQNVVATPDTTSISVDWDDVVAADLAGYNVYVGGVKNNVSLIASSTYNITGLTAETEYSITVSSEDFYGNESAQTSPVLSTTLSSNNTRSLLLGSNALMTLPHDVLEGTDYTVMFWIKPNEIPFSTTPKNIFEVVGGSHIWEMRLEQSNVNDQAYGNLVLQLKNGTASSTLSPVSSSTFPDYPGTGSGGTTLKIDELARDLWSHLAITVSSGLAKWYMNGTLINQQSGLNVTPDSFAGTWYLGDNGGSPAVNIDLLSMWNVALTQDQIRNYVYNINYSGTTGLRHLYRFNNDLSDAEGNQDITPAGSFSFPTTVPIITNDSIPPSNGMIWVAAQDGQVGPMLLAQHETGTDPVFWHTFYSIATPALGGDSATAVNKFGELAYGSQEGHLAIILPTGEYKWRVQPNASDDFNWALKFDASDNIFVAVEVGGTTANVIKKYSYIDGSELASYTLPSGEVVFRGMVIDKDGFVYICIDNGDGTYVIRKLENDLSGPVASGWTENSFSAGSGGGDLRILRLDPYNDKLTICNIDSADETFAHMIDATDGTIDGTFEAPVASTDDRSFDVRWSPVHDCYWVQSLTDIWEYTSARVFTASRISGLSSINFNADILFDGVRTASLWDNNASGSQNRSHLIFDVDPTTNVWTYKDNYLHSTYGNNRSQVLHPGDPSLYI